MEIPHRGPMHNFLVSSATLFHFYIGFRFGILHAVWGKMTLLTDLEKKGLIPKGK